MESLFSTRAEIFGFEAFQMVMSLTIPKRLEKDGITKDCYEMWFKIGSRRLFVGEFSPSGRFPIWTTVGKKTERRRTTKHDDCYAFLNEESKDGEGGVFFIPSQPRGFPLARYVVTSDDVAAEMDEGSLSEQREVLTEFVANSGLSPAYIVFSGGKSYHPHWKTTGHVTVEQTVYLRMLLCIALGSDPAIVNIGQPMRLAGFYRQEKGTEQSLVYHSPYRYSYGDLVEGMSAAIEAKGLPVPKELDRERFLWYKRARMHGRSISDALTLPIEELRTKWQKVSDRRIQELDDLRGASEGYPLWLALSSSHKMCLNGVDCDRNNTGYALLLDLMGCENWFNDRGLKYNGSVEHIFYRFCQGCQPGGDWGYYEWERILRSASQKRLTARPCRELYGFVRWYDNQLRKGLAA